MARDPLQVVLLVRHRAVEALRDGLAVSLEAEKAAAAVVAAVDVMAQQERAEADRLSGQELPIILGQINMLGIRLDQLRYLGRRAVAGLTAAQERTLKAAADLATARSAERIIEQLIEQRLAEQRRLQEIRDGHTLDDIARYRHRVHNGLS